MMSTMTTTTLLRMGWSVSRGRETDGYNIRSLTDTDTGKRYRCMGGGYDMTGTVLADWFTDRYADRIMSAVESGELVPYSTVTDGPDPDGPLTRTYADDGAREGRGSSRGDYGLTVLAYGEHASNPSPSIDGACGESSVLRIIRACGFDVRAVYGGRQSRQGVLEYVVTEV